MKINTMKRLITILLVLFSITAFSQYRYTMEDGEYAISSLGSKTYVTNTTGIVNWPTPIERAMSYKYVASGANLDTLTTTRTKSGFLYVGLEPGGTFTGTLTIADDSVKVGRGAVANVRAGKSGANPKIYGSDLIDGWTLHSGNIYKATFATDITQLFVDGEKLQVARLTNTGYNLVTGFSSRTVVTLDCASQADNYYVGCTAITRTKNWYSETRTVTSSTGSTLTLSAATSSDFNVGEGILLMNKLEFLDAPGEWFYDTATNTVYVWMPNNDSPSGYEMRGSTIDNGINLGANSYVTISNLNILQQKNAGIKSAGSNIYGVSIQNCLIEGQDNYGIHVDITEFTTGSGFTITNNELKDISATAIWGYRVGLSTISNNTISNIGLFENWGIGTRLYSGDGNAIEWSDMYAVGENAIQYNNLYNVGYDGILWRGVADIQYNYIYGSCLAKSDGAAIYTGSALSSGSLVANNIIDYVLGTKAGGQSTRNLGEGVYLDENSVGVTVEYNTIMDCSSSGVFMHKPNNHIARYNKILDTRCGFLTSNTSTGTSTFENNLVAIGKATDDYEDRQLLIRETTDGVTINTNTYVNGFASDLVYRIDDATPVDFAGWKTATGHDAGSTYISTDLGANETQRLVYNNTKVAKTFYLNNATSVKDENGTAITSSFIVNPFESKYARGLNVNCILDYQDATAPTITVFEIPATSDSPIVTISTFTATGATAYKITESATTPLLTDSGWSSEVPTTYTAMNAGSVTLYAWVRDAAGNISSAASDETTIPDITANLIADYDFSETSGTVSNDLVGSADGTINGSPTVDGSPLLLDGVDDNITYPLPSVISSSSYANDFSINLKFSIPTTPASTKRLFYQGFSFTRGIQIGINGNRDIYAIITENDTPTMSGKIKSIGVTLSQTYNVTVTWDATAQVLRMYMDGVEVTTTYSSNSLNGNSSGMIVGSQLAAAYINANVYEFSVFDKKLSDSEVYQWINR